MEQTWRTDSGREASESTYETLWDGVHFVILTDCCVCTEARHLAASASCGVIHTYALPDNRLEFADGLDGHARVLRQVRAVGVVMEVRVQLERRKDGDEVGTDQELDRYSIRVFSGS